MKIFACIIGVIVLSIFAVFQITKVLVRSAERFFVLIRGNQIEAAYALTSKKFQETITFPVFKEAVANSKLSDYSRISWTSRKIQNTTGTLCGFVLVSGKKMPVEMIFTKEAGVWKILHLDVAKSASVST